MMIFAGPCTPWAARLNRGQSDVKWPFNEKRRLIARDSSGVWSYGSGHGLTDL